MRLGHGLGRIGAKLRFKGIVQGVGFRPFLYNLATGHRIVGYVRNLGDAGVEAHVEGDRDRVEAFIQGLRTKSPPVCEVADLRVEFADCLEKFHEFTIYASDRRRPSFGSMIPPDIGICPQCIDDVLDQASRWYSYPFTCCASCGPRFTAVFDLPYDRGRTNMMPFRMCPSCGGEYEDPKDRRFHAQGICCSSCGPKIRLHDRTGALVEERQPLKEASHLLDEGAVIAVKGIGGIHVAASATQDKPLLKIRLRKRKPFQPFAVMSPDIDRVREFAYASDLEAQILQDWRRPIVALAKLPNNALSDQVAPGLDTLGVMLPYTGIHLLLTHYCQSPALVMTSGNISGLPMAIANDEGAHQLSDVVDYFLLHDREIVSRCDDSVVRVLGSVSTFIRRSRGFVPTPIEVPLTARTDVMGVGAEFRTVGSILHGTQCYLTQHIGDVDTLETMMFLQDALQHMMRLTGVSCHDLVVVHDAHPRYLTSKMAKDLSEKWNGTTLSVQHHHAHAASLMADNAIAPDESIVAIAADGVGYGINGEAWGGEVLVASYADFERVGHLAKQPMPGGDICAKFPLRMCAAILAEHLDDNNVRSILLSKEGRGSLGETDLDRIGAQLKNDVTITRSSSTGRVLDAMAAGAGICLERTYEGEPAMRLEAVAATGNDASPLPMRDLIVRQGSILTVDTTALLLEALLAIGRNSVPDACASFQNAVAEALADVAISVAKERDIQRVGITGGVAVNAKIVETTRRCVEREGLRFLQHRRVPPGDGGISLGQAVVAASRL